MMGARVRDGICRLVVAWRWWDWAENPQLTRLKKNPELPYGVRLRQTKLQMEAFLPSKQINYSYKKRQWKPRPSK
jgi:hypothetical protein